MFAAVLLRYEGVKDCFVCPRIRLSRLKRNLLKDEINGSWWENFPLDRIIFRINYHGDIGLKMASAGWTNAKTGRIFGSADGESYY